ncbi:MAG: imidazole glycerol phosphate synthase subunit HisH, partial [Desulfovibrionaceae bacterium]|nr:imidazole glycerol phosphate synthase subunit HisH [Desulfovibrionaceae bacterium]
MLAILDYKAGNQTSVRRALEHLGIPCTITADAGQAESAQGIIFPGVGAAGQAMNALTESGLDAVLRRAVAQGQPLLGICLGCQILLSRSEENDTPTLDVLPGLCRRFEDGLTQEDGTAAPVPHMGWNSLNAVAPCCLL